MKNSNLMMLTFVILCSFTLSLWAQTITKDEFINQLKQVHPMFEKERLTSQIEQEQQRSFLGAQDWNIFSSFFVSRENPALAIFGPERTDAIGIEAGVRKVFWNTGGRFSASYSTGTAKLNINPMWGIPDHFYQHQVNLSYIHPLLKNRKGFLDKLQYELKQFDINFAEIQALENQEDFLTEVIIKFLDWVLLSEQSKIVNERLKLSRDELARTERKREANLVDEVDVLRASDAVRIAEQNQVLIEGQWKGLQAELAALTRNKEITNCHPMFDISKIETLPTEQNVRIQLKEKSRLLKMMQIRLDQLQMVRKGYEETNKPDLSLFTVMNTKRYDDDFTESFNIDKYDIAAGLQFSTPLEKRTNKHQIQKTDLQIQQLQSQKDEIEIALSSALSNLLIQISEMESVLKLNQQQIESARKKTEEELKLYNQGRGSLTFVILGRDGEENAKLIYVQNAVIYHKLVVQYRSLVDELL